MLLCVVALILARITHNLLIGQSATAEDQARVIELTEGVDGVEKVTQLLSLHIGPEEVLVAMKIAFRAGMPVEEVEEVTNEIERRVRADMPRMRRIFIEVDAHGDGRGTLAPRPQGEPGKEARA